MSTRKSTLTPQGIQEAIDLLLELDHTLTREDDEVSRSLLRALVSYTAWLSDYDEIFDALQNDEQLDFEQCARWARWQLGNLRLEAAIHDPDSEAEGSMSRETKPYSVAIANELIDSSKRSTAEHEAVRPSTDNHDSLSEDTEDSSDSEFDAFDLELDALMADIVDSE